MKWKIKGHEFDKIAKEFLNKWNITREIYIFGAGNIGFFYKKLLDKYNLFSGFIDNFKYTEREDTVSPDEFISKNSKGWVILCASHENMKEMEIQITEVQNKDFFLFGYPEFFNHIFPILSVYAEGKIYDHLCQISLTERCTLRCEKCAHGCWNVSRASKDMDFNEACRTADNYFKYFDYILEFVLIGGEPLMYEKLSDVVDYIGKRYRDKIITFAITTNGTIFPTNELIQTCKNHDVHFHISNYSKTLPHLRSRYKKLCELLEDKKISFDLSHEDDMWMDYGFDSLIRDREEDLTAVFDNCHTPCREVRGNKYYYCVQARAVNENMSFGVGKKDFLNLTGILGEDDKKILLEFNMGYSKKGYLDMCRYCYGKDAIKHIIPRAVQSLK